MPVPVILNGNRWQVSDIKAPCAEPTTLNIANQSQSVHISSCQGSNTFIIAGDSKTAAISLNNCSEISMLVSVGVLSNVEIINCKKVKIQLDSTVPSVSIDGSEAVTIYQMAQFNESKKTIYYTSKSSEVNILYQTENHDDEMQEIAIPEQFKSYFDIQGNMKTEPVQHASA